MFYRRAIFYFLSVSALPLNFIFRTRNFYIIFRLKNNTNCPTFGSPNSPKINDVIKSAQKCDTLENFFRKLTLSSHGHVVAYSCSHIRHNFSFRQLSPRWGENCPKEKSFTPIFSETSVNFLNFFHRRIRFDCGHKWPRLQDAEVRRLRVGQKQIFETGEKWFLSLQKIGKFRESHPLDLMLKIWEILGNQFSSFRGFNPPWVVLFCRVTVKIHWL